MQADNLLKEHLNHSFGSEKVAKRYEMGILSEAVNATRIISLPWLLGKASMKSIGNIYDWDLALRQKASFGMSSVFF